MAPEPRVTVEGVIRTGITHEGGDLYERDRTAALVTVANEWLDKAAVDEGADMVLAVEIGKRVVLRLLAEHRTGAAPRSGAAPRWCSACSVEPATETGRCRSCEAAIAEERDNPAYG
jgi:hypothetical protein